MHWPSLALTADCPQLRYLLPFREAFNREMEDLAKGYALIIENAAHELKNCLQSNPSLGSILKDENHAAVDGLKVGIVRSAHHFLPK